MYAIEEIKKEREGKENLISLAKSLKTEYANLINEAKKQKDNIYDNCIVSQMPHRK